jgi:hypothetical protein
LEPWWSGRLFQVREIYVDATRDLTCCEAAGVGQGASNEPSGLYCHCLFAAIGVGVEGGFGEASTDVGTVGVEREGMAGDGGGGIEFAVGVLRAGVCESVIMGVEAGFAKALGFLCHSLNLAGDMRSLTMRDVGSDTLSSRASYRKDLDALGSWCV